MSAAVNQQQPGRRRFWVLTAAALLGAGVTLALGMWQLGRAEQKKALQQRMQVQAALPMLDVSTLRAADAGPDLVHRQVQARGHWEAAHTVFLDNRQMDGRPGFFVVTPLRLSGSPDVILVQRGWAPRNFEDRTRLPEVSTPAGPVRVQGRMAPPPGKLYEIGDAPAGAIRQNLDLAAFREQTGLPLLPLSIQQTDASGDDGLSRNWPQVDAGVDKHYGYAFQWFGLCALITGLYVWFQIVKRIQGRRA